MKNLLLLFLLLLTLTACEKKEVKSFPDLSLKRKELLHANMATEVRSLDPCHGYEASSSFFVKMLFEGLMRLGPTGEIIPGVAESYEISEDQKVYTFHLRSSNWIDGSPVTAYDFEYAWKRIVNPATATRAAHNFYAIKNVQAVVKGNASMDTLGIRAVDDKTFVVELEHPAPYFLEAITTAPFRPIPAELDQKDPQWSTRLGKDFICNGPFRLKEWTRSNSLIIVKNSHYWRADEIRLDGIKVSFIKEEPTALMMFEKGELDWIGRPLTKIPLDAILTLKKEGKLIERPTFGLYWYFFNTETFPFNNKKMRLAFAYAINRREIVEDLLEEDERPAMSIFSSFLALQKTPYFPDGDVELARKLFDEALEELGLTKEKLPPITLSGTHAEVARRLSQIVQEQWHRAFGIEVKLEHEEWNCYYDRVAGGKYQIAGMNWITWIKDPIYILQTFKYRSSGMNMPKWEDSRYQALLSASDDEIDLHQRQELLHQAEKLLLEEMPVTPVYFLTATFAQSPRVKNISFSELADVDFTWAYIERECR